MEYLSKQKFDEFKRQMKYKAEMYGIKVVEADRFYASSKTCSHCGHIKKDLKLSDRTYVCPVCGAKLDRDLNAAINLANYKTAQEISLARKPKYVPIATREFKPVERYIKREQPVASATAKSDAMNQEDVLRRTSQRKYV